MKKIFISIFLILLVSIESVPTEISLPISADLFFRLGLSMKRLEGSLKYFNTKYQNKYEIWKRVQLTKKYLHEVSKELARYNNVIAGAQNSVNGNKNVIVGNYNNIEGSNNWVFISNFVGNISGDLLISQWRVQLDKSQFILKNPKIAISFIDEDKNKNLKKKEYKKNRKACKWGDWAKPTQKQYKTWNKYSGYDQYVNQWQKKQYSKSKQSQGFSTNGNSYSNSNSNSNSNSYSNSYNGYYSGNSNQKVSNNNLRGYESRSQSSSSSSSSNNNGNNGNNENKSYSKSYHW